jgi:hypothetical protein
MSKHREDYLHLRSQSGWGVGPNGTFGQQRLRLFTCPIVNSEGVAAFLQVCRHAATHYTQTDETDVHLSLQVRVLGCEFGDGLNLIEICLLEVDCCASNDLVHLLRLACTNDRGGYGGMAQGPGHRDSARGAAMTISDHVQSLY